MLIGYLRLRAFITTLITLIVYRSAYDLLILDYSNQIAAAFPDFPSGISSAAAICSAFPAWRWSMSRVAIFGHIFLTRLRPGWHVTAIGGSRRSAYNSGIPVRRTIALCYVRERRADRDRRAVLRRAPRHRRRRHRRRARSDGADRDGARRHQPRRRQGLGRQGAGRHADRAADDQRPDHAVGAGRRQPHGAGRRPARRRDDRHPLAEEPHRIISKVYVSPTYHALPPPPSTAPGSGSPFAQNDKLRDVSADRARPHRGARGRHPRSRRQSLCRLAPWRHHALSRARLRAAWRCSRISAASRSAWPSTATTISMSASAAWASIASRPTARSKRPPTRPTAACAPSTTTAACGSPTISTSRDDGRIFFSEATVRYEMHEWPVDGLEARGNGRIICYDPPRRTTTHRAARAEISQRHLHRERRPIHSVRGDLGLLGQALLVRRPEDRQGRDGAGQPARLSRQHQSGLGRQLLAGDGRHAQPRARSGVADAGLPHAHGASACRSTNGCSRTSTPAASSSSTRRARSWSRSGICDARQSSHDHLDARASRLSLSRRHRATTASAATSSRAPTRTSFSMIAVGGAT